MGTVCRKKGRRAVAAWGLGFALGVCWTGAASAADPENGIIDVHFHAHPHGRQSGNATFDTDGAAREALKVMDNHGVAVAVIMPPPMPHGHPAAYDYPELKRMVAANPGRFAFFGGGGTLNGMIHNADPRAVSDALRAEFAHTARAILAAGARGFGELTALHLSLDVGHPFIAAPPNHPLFLLLADIAAERGVPIDLHMEAVARDRPTPPRVLSQGQGNPQHLTANLAALERLLAHNRKAPIIWSHLGWDNTGNRGPALMRRLLGSHPNLYMSIKLRNVAMAGRQKNRKGGEGGAGNPVAADGTIKPAWLALIEAFPDRFLIGSDTHVFVSRKSARIGADRTAAFVRALPEHLARAVARENARRLLRLP